MIETGELISGSSRSLGSSASSAISSQDGASSAGSHRDSDIQHSSSPRENLESPSAVQAALAAVEASKRKQQVKVSSVILLSCDLAFDICEIYVCQVIPLSLYEDIKVQRTILIYTVKS